MDAMLIGFPSLQFEASREQRTELIHLMAKRHPGKTEAERFELLQAMSSSERYRLFARPRRPRPRGPACRHQLRSSRLGSRCRQ